MSKPQPQESQPSELEGSEEGVREVVRKLMFMLETVRIVETYMRLVNDEVIDALLHGVVRDSNKVLMSMYVNTAIQRLNELKETIEKL
jgi:hypothetical protein